MGMGAVKQRHTRVQPGAQRQAGWKACLVCSAGHDRIPSATGMPLQLANSSVALYCRQLCVRCQPCRQPLLPRCCAQTHHVGHGIAGIDVGDQLWLALARVRALLEQDNLRLLRLSGKGRGEG